MKYKALCASCGKQFMVDESQERKDNKWTRCPHCQSRICISFLGWCPTCHDYMAFKQRFAKDLGKGVIDFISSIPSIASSSKRLGIFAGFARDVKNAYKGYSGQCLMVHISAHCCGCDKVSIKCPSCGTIIHTTEDPHLGASYTCDHCGKQIVYG